MTPPPPAFDVAIIGFGFSGLATLMNLTREGCPPSVVIVAPDRSGHGLAYRTTRAFHLLNVVAERMGAWAGDEEHFAGWLDTPSASCACQELCVPRPGPDEFAPRALFARYLDELRDTALRRLADDGVQLRWIGEPARSLVPAGGGWEIRCETSSVRARQCVLAVGNDERHVFGELRHPRLLDGPWALRGANLPPAGAPAVLIGTGLTAVDALLSLRACGHRDEVLALSRHGLLPRAHDHALQPLAVAEEEMTGVRTLADVIRLVSAQRAAGHEWREVIDGLRPLHGANLAGPVRGGPMRGRAALGVDLERLPPPDGAGSRRSRGRRDRRRGGCACRRPLASSWSSPTTDWRSSSPRPRARWSASARPS